MLVAPAIELEHIIPLKHIGGESAISDGPQVVFGAIHTLCAVVRCPCMVGGTMRAIALALNLSLNDCGASALALSLSYGLEPWP